MRHTIPTKLGVVIEKVCLILQLANLFSPTISFTTNVWLYKEPHLHNVYHVNYILKK